MTVDEALRTLEEHLSRSIMANISEVEVMHGLGSGKLKTLSLSTLEPFQSLKELSHHLIWSYSVFIKIAPTTNPEQN